MRIPFDTEQNGYCDSMSIALEEFSLPLVTPYDYLSIMHYGSGIPWSVKPPHMQTLGVTPFKQSAVIFIIASSIMLRNLNGVKYKGYSNIPVIQDTALRL